jgi:perosamine synthetase
MPRAARRVVRSPLKAVVVGCGAIAPTHVSAYHASGLARVVAVSDLRVPPLAGALDRWRGIKAYRDYRQMLANIHPDLVSVCIWPDDHAEAVIAAADAGARGILCEKPIALQLDDIERMRLACQSHGVRLAGGHQYRFHPCFQAAARAIQSGQIGTIQHVRGYVTGALADNGPHLVDAARYLIGDPVPISARCRCERGRGGMYQALPVEDSASGTITFTAGIEFWFRTGDLASGFFGLTVEGARGTIEVTPSRWAINGEAQREGLNASESVYRARQFREFAEWVKGSRSNYAGDADQATQAAEMVLALYESARTNETVEFPLENRGDVIRQLYAAAPPRAPADQPAPAPIAPSRDGTRLAIDGGQRAVRRWFSSDPYVGLPELARLTRVIASRKLSRTYGYQVDALEAEFARTYGSLGAVASTSGTAAIHIALGAINPEPLDEIVTTPLTDLGTVIPILACNCIPVYADVDPLTGNMTAQTIAARITPRTRAVILVHLFGRPADLGPISELLRQRHVALIEDCSQAHLAEYHGRKVGTFGDLGCFSLQQSKQMTCGDGGITLVNREDLLQRAALYADKGWSRDLGREHLFLGMNYRMTELQAAVARGQLRRLPGLMARRRASAEALTSALKRIDGAVPPPDLIDGASSWWVYAFGIDPSALGLTLDDMADVLRAEGLRLMRRYLPCPVFEYQVFQHLRTYGSSGYPFTAVDYVPPRREEYPGFMAFQEEHLFIPWSNRARVEHAEAIGRAVAKVARSFQPRLLDLRALRPATRAAAARSGPTGATSPASGAAIEQPGPSPRGL